MRKSFEELITNTLISKKEAIELMELIRLKTIKECADKAEADWNYNKIINNNDETGFTDIECYVLRESILQLDKDSIEI